MSRNTLLLLLAVLILLCCCLIMVTGATALLFFRSASSSTEVWPTPEGPGPTVERTATARATPQPAATPLPERSFTTPLPPPVAGAEAGSTTEEQLAAALVPAADPIDLAARLQPELGPVPRVVNQNTPNYRQGDTLTFWASNVDSEDNFQVEARLVVKSAHLYMWVEEGVSVNESALRRAAQFFDEQIYPTNRAFFGSEWTPGIDNDPRLHVLHATGLGESIAGYFSSADEVSRLINEYSNEKEMFYINLDNNTPGSEFYNGTLTHEFQHMIHWYQDQNESTWLNEGASELAMQLNGLQRSEDSYRPDEVFAEDPDLQLNTWPADESYPHYGNAYLFLNYFLGRFGEEATQALVAHQENEMTSVENTLRDLGYAITADELFGDWVVANWVDDPSQADGRYGYPTYDPANMNPSQSHRRLPARGSDTVHQYAADYIVLPASADLTIQFQGDATTRLAATQAYSGQWAWWGHRVDESDTRLTLPVDLTGLDSATLRYRMWYDIEELWDYAYIAVSTDDGATWQIQRTAHTTDENPQGSAFGPGYSGLSGSGTVARWLREEVDLSPFAGQKILIRFEYITDAAVTHPGIFIDDVEIPELDCFNDFEQGPGDWQGEGWLLTNNVLSQKWLVQLIETQADGEVQVHRVPVGIDGTGQLVLTGLDDRGDLVLAISALAPVTVETAAYEYMITATNTP